MENIHSIIIKLRTPINKIGCRIRSFIFYSCGVEAFVDLSILNDDNLSCVIQYTEIVLRDELIYERSNNIYDSIMPILLSSKRVVEGTQRFI